MDSNIIVIVFIFLIFIILLLEINKNGRERFYQNKKTFVSLILDNYVDQGPYELTINGMPVNEFLRYLETHKSTLESFYNVNDEQLKINLNIDEKSDVFKQIKSKFLDMKKNKKVINVPKCPVYLPKSFISNVCPGCK